MPVDDNYTNMYMASFSPTINSPLWVARLRSHRALQVTSAKKCDGEGRSFNNIVDSNLHVLKARIEGVKKKEIVAQEIGIGWNYAPYKSDYKANIEKELIELIRVVGMATGTLGLTVITCSFLLYIIISLITCN